MEQKLLRKIHAIGIITLLIVICLLPISSGYIIEASTTIEETSELTKDVSRVGEVESSVPDDSEDNSHDELSEEQVPPKSVSEDQLVEGDEQLEVDSSGTSAVEIESDLCVIRGPLEEGIYLKREELSEDLMLEEPNGYYLVKFIGEIQPDWLQQLEDMGALVLNYVPEYSYVVYTTEEIMTTVRNCDFYLWDGLYHPGYRLDEGLDPYLNQEEVDLSVELQYFAHEGADELIALAQSLGRTIVEHEPSTCTLRMNIKSQDLNEFINMESLSWIQQQGEKIVCMNNVREYTGIDFVFNDYGYDGTGIIGMVRDDGLDENHLDYKNRIIHVGGPVEDRAHGTVMTGIIGSSGEHSAEARGVLPNSEIMFYHWSIDRMPSMLDLFNAGGVFQCNGWVQGYPTAEYNQYSQKCDQAVFYYDRTSLWAAGNAGNQGAGTLYPDGVAKNVITVGGINTYNDDDRNNDAFEPIENQGLFSQGPADDGRIKPDVIGPGDNVNAPDSVDGDWENGYRIGNYVTYNGDDKFGGTSAATAVVSGMSGLIYEMYQDNMFGNNPKGDLPHASTVKSLLIADAYQYDFSVADRFQQGWGMPDLENTHTIGTSHFIVDENYALQTGEKKQFVFTPDDYEGPENIPLKISLVWTDPPASTSAAIQLVNNLDLKVTAPDGTVYWGNYGLEEGKWSQSHGNADILNNVENVFIQSPQYKEAYLIEVIAANIAQDGHLETAGVYDQDFALVATKGSGHKLACGDADGDGTINISDVVYLINYIFGGGPAPKPLCAGEVDGDDCINISDVVYLINYIFGGGPEPVPTCCE